MNDVLKTVAKFLLYLFATVVILWTASLSVSLVKRLLPSDDVTPYFALALFDGGALVWLLVFIAQAKGLVQRSIALMMTSLDLLGVGFMSFAELYLGGQTFAEIPPDLGKMVIWAVGGYTIANVIAIYVFHIGDPDVAQEIELRTQQDKIFAEAMKQSQSQLEANSYRLGNLISQELTRKALYGLRLLDPDGDDGLVIDGKLQEPRKNITPKRNIISRLFGRFAAKAEPERQYAASTEQENGSKPDDKETNPTPPLRPE